MYEKPACLEESLHHNQEQDTFDHYYTKTHPLFHSIVHLSNSHSYEIKESNNSYITHYLQH